jgi:diacylglycerol kinase family enzyme
MKKTYVLYNPIAGNQDGEQSAKKLSEMYPSQELEYRDITKITDYGSFLSGLCAEDDIIVCGGDGTLNRFINGTYDLSYENQILYYATGNGNDFLRDVGNTEDHRPIVINSYLKDLPTVTVNGKTYHFLNGIGFGIDGYCCEVGDKLREEGKKPNYTAIAIKGLLYGYHATGATVTIDGVTKRYRKTWIAPTMYGRYYGGGMMPAPAQNRLNPDKTVSFAAIHDSGKLHTLCVFPKIFSGKHIEHTAMVDVIQGHDITVEFDRPAALQIDGETILGVTRYQVRSAVSHQNAGQEEERKAAV